MPNIDWYNEGSLKDKLADARNLNNSRYMSEIENVKSVYRKMVLSKDNDKAKKIAKSTILSYIDSDLNQMIPKDLTYKLYESRQFVKDAPLDEKEFDLYCEGKTKRTAMLSDKYISDRMVIGNAHIDSLVAYYNDGLEFDKLKEWYEDMKDEEPPFSHIEGFGLLGVDIAKYVEKSSNDNDYKKHFDDYPKWKNKFKDKDIVPLLDNGEIIVCCKQEKMCYQYHHGDIDNGVTSIPLSQFISAAKTAHNDIQKILKNPVKESALLDW